MLPRWPGGHRYEPNGGSLLAAIQPGYWFQAHWTFSCPQSHVTPYDRAAGKQLLPALFSWTIVFFAAAFSQGILGVQ